MNLTYESQQKKKCSEIISDLECLIENSNGVRNLKTFFRANHSLK